MHALFILIVFYSPLVPCLVATMATDNAYSRLILQEAEDVVRAGGYTDSEELMNSAERKLRAVLVATTQQIDELLKLRAMYYHEHQTLLARLRSFFPVFDQVVPPLPVGTDSQNPEMIPAAPTAAGAPTTSSVAPNSSAETT